VHLGLEIGNCGLAALFPNGEDGEHLREGTGAKITERCDGGDVNGWWTGGGGKAGGKEAGVDG
jgi:hypothetical protein